MIGRWAQATLAAGLLVVACGASAPQTSSPEMPTATIQGAASLPPPGSSEPIPAASPSPTPSLPYASHEDAQPVGSVIFGPLVRDAMGKELIDEGAPEPQGTPALTLTVGPSEQGLTEAGLPGRYTFGAFWAHPLDSPAIVVSVYRVKRGALELLFANPRSAAPAAIGYSETLPAFNSNGRYRLEVTTPDGIVLAWGLLDINGTCASSGCSGG